MKHPRTDKTGHGMGNHYERIIQRATGAAPGDLGCIENIMREEILHSTLDWQTTEQLADAAREAHRRLTKDRELYDLDHACRVAMFRKMRAEAGFRENSTPEKRIAVATAEAEYQAAQSRLFTLLDDTSK